MNKKFKENFIIDTIEFLENSERNDDDVVARADPTGNSFKYITTFYYPLGGFFNFACTDYSKEMYDQHGWYDSFSVSIGSDKMQKYLLSDEAY